MDTDFTGLWIDGPSAARDYEVRYGTHGELVMVGFETEQDARDWINARNNPPQSRERDYHPYQS